MIVGNRKSFEEIVGMLGSYGRVLVLGCRECVTVCAVGGEREVGVLASELRLYYGRLGREVEVGEAVVERQCDYEYIDSVRSLVGGYEVILSMACGAGVQYVAERYRERVVLPAVDTTFLGVAVEQGVWAERCQGCGQCILHLTAGVCPVARCAKSLLNGPCGGSSGGKCEVDREVDCAWQLIVDRLKAMGQLDRYREIIPVKDWSFSRDGGPRRRVREDMRL